LDEVGARRHFDPDRPAESSPSGAPGLLFTWDARVRSLPFVVRALICVALLLLVYVLDMSTSPELALSIFYLLPTLFAGAYLSRGAGRAVALASALSWGYLESLGHLYSTSAYLFWNTGVRLLFLVLINELVCAVRDSHAEQVLLARTDTVTGVANSRVFKEGVELTMARSLRTGLPFTVVYIDLDKFKEVNDSFGHFEGDRLLAEFAALLAGDLRVTDVLARLGGDEFGILMPDTNEISARALLQRIDANVCAALTPDWKVSATYGAVTFRSLPGDAEVVVGLADHLMFRGKAQGGSVILQETWPAAT
jgi:diguanylate cyclase (GGDEF)-like protein